MSNKREIMNFAEDINKIKEQKLIREYYVKCSENITEDVFNHIVILLTMCVNKELQLAFDVIDDDIGVEMYPKKVMGIYNNILSLYQEENVNIVKKANIPETEISAFLEYLNNMVKCLLSGLRYIFKKEGEKWYFGDAKNEWNTRYRREERVRDNMKSVVSKGMPFAKYTITHNIEVPYMYILAWDIPTLYEYYGKPLEEYISGSYVKNILFNTSFALNNISDNLIDILLHGMQVDKENFEDETERNIFRVCKEVNYRRLLPTISLGESVDYNNDLENPRGRFIASKNHVVPYIKKEILKKIPLLPMELDKKEYGSIKSIEYMINLIKEENKTKDYLESDILCMKNGIVSICQKLLDWIQQNNSKVIVSQKEVVSKYITTIINSVNNDPRKSNEANRKDYFRKVATEIAKEWDKNNLKFKTPRNDDGESYISYAYFSVLKLSRNWISHKVIQDVSISFTVFLFLITIRYIVEANRLDLRFQAEFGVEEERLLELLGEKSIVYDKIELLDLKNEYQIMRQNVFESAFENGNTGWLGDFPEKGLKPHKVLTAAGHDKSKIKNKMSENEIFLAFWLSIHMGDDNIPRKIDFSKDTHLIEILERTYSYQQKSNLLKE